ncbi:hypothetical protein TanjilG_05162 [Lupinus angustifolius]|uniref:Myotubularin phosphatase domain-containing protein n=1 Tax=Lupinus angustifolius TaxID=3871 RepID=A0A1J7FNY2_LUPAN|nr:hypothetical protein TanjilG_05162 [Lupinus angustifolius]
MDLPKHRNARATSLRDATESSKMEGTGSLDSLEWTKIEPISRYVSNANLDFLLEAEQVVAESEGTRKIIALGTIPLATIEKFNKIVVKVQSNARQLDKIPPQRLLQVLAQALHLDFGTQMGYNAVISLQTRRHDKLLSLLRRVIFDALQRCIKPARFWDLYAFASGPSRFKNTSPQVRLLDEYFRLIGKGSYRASINMIESGSFTLSNDLWRISSVNFNYKMCQSYPFALLVPNIVSDDELLQASNFRARGRLPVVSWCHPGTGAVLARSSQPLVGLMMNMRSNMDEKLVAALCSKLDDGLQRKLYIADARPRKNALANGAMGGGSESSSNYFQSEIVFLGIDNIHAMRESYARLREYVDTHGRASSDGMSSFLRHGASTWGGGNLSSMSTSVSTLGDSGWLLHVQNVLAGSAWIAARIAMEMASVLVHCSDGWDRTSQLVSLANLLLDPYYRTFAGFQALIEKDWLAFGHPFSDRVGMPSLPGSGNMPSELSRQSSIGSFSTSSMRQSSGAFTSQPPASSQTHNSNNYSPIFLQWIDCVSQLLRMYPSAFEFSAAFLVDFMDCMLSCGFGNFFCNCEKERLQCNVFEACGCLWEYLADLRKSGGSHVHYNPFYEPLKHNGPLLPPAAALAPTLWPQFHLRWACPEEAKAGEIEEQCRKIIMKNSEMQKAKEVAERKAKEIINAMESLNAELRMEKQQNNSAMNIAKRTSKENMAIKRAIQSIGYKIHFSSNGDCNVDIESNTLEAAPNCLYSSTGDNDGINAIGRVCETLCPFRSADGGCRWPNGDCAQFGSQFVGLKANFDAFDQLSINDSYFKSE